MPHTIPFVIFALGKLGGRELNYSSDIDLVFAHAGSGDAPAGFVPWTPACTSRRWLKN